MITLFHGDDIVSSRRALPKGIHYEAKDLTPEKLEQILGGEELFGTAKTIIIEGLVKSLPGTKKDVYLWVGKKLSSAQVKNFPGVQIKEFKIPQVLWQFLSSRQLKDLEACLKTEPVELVWYLLHRSAAKKGQVELLKKMYAIELAVKSGKTDVPLRTQLELLL